jgi:NAD-dependent SIR2 family protein deacetylase
MGFLFPCPKCHAIYVVRRINEPPQQPPKCVDCGEDLPWGDSADWFDYRQIKPELPDAAASQALE